MPCYLITAADDDLIQTSVFRAGPGGAHEAVVAFTDEATANEYLDADPKEGQSTVAEIRDVDFMVWLADAYRDGVRYVAVNPKRSEQEEGRRLTVIDVSAQLEAAGAKILRLMRPDF